MPMTVRCSMRLMILSLFLCVVTPAFCQSPVPAPISTYKLGQIPSAVSHSEREFCKFPVDWHMMNGAPSKLIILPNAGVARHWDDAQIDPKIIVNPPQSSIGIL